MSYVASANMIQGYDVYITLDSSTVLNVKSVSMDFPRSKTDQGYLGQDSTIPIYGPITATGSFDFDQVVTSDVSTYWIWDNLMEAHLNRGRLAFEAYPGGASSGQRYVKGTIAIDNIPLSIESGETPANGTVNFSFVGDPSLGSK